MIHVLYHFINNHGYVYNIILYIDINNKTLIDSLFLLNFYDFYYLTVSIMHPLMFKLNSCHNPDPLYKQLLSTKI